MSLLGMVAGLGRAGVPFVVVGGVAATAHGSARVTDDLDVCYDTAPASLDKLARLLRDWRAYPRGIEPGLPFVMDAHTLRAAPVLTLETSEGRFDLLDVVAGVGNYSACLAASESIDVTIDGQPVRFRALTLDALIRAKRATGRRKDIDHLVELEAIAATIKARPKGA
jgi:hypothetical protein